MRAAGTRHFFSGDSEPRCLLSTASRRGRIRVSTEQHTALSELNRARGAAGISAAAFEGFGYFLSITAVENLKDLKPKTELF